MSPFIAFGLVPKLPLGNAQSAKLPLRLSQVKVSNARRHTQTRSLPKRSFEKLRSPSGELGNEEINGRLANRRISVRWRRGRR